VLPSDVAVLEVTDATPGFHPRFEARGKVYRYRIFNRAVRSPLHRRTTWHVRRSLDLDAMREAAKLLVGEHDFRGFRASDCTRKSTRRIIRRIDISKEDSFVDIEVEGTAFLKNMVRILAGSLVGVAQHRLALAKISEILAHGDRTQAGVTAPAAGLT